MKSMMRGLPDTVKLLFENEFVMVVELHLKPGNVVPSHQTGNRIVYSLTDNTVQITEGDSLMVNEWKDGDVHWHEAGPHPELKNIGTTDARFIVVSRSAIDLPAVPIPGHVEELSLVIPDRSNMIVDNDYVRLIEVGLKPHDRVPPHYEGIRTIYALTDYTVRVTDRGKESVNTWKAGDIHWHEAGPHPALENVSDVTARYLVFVFKK
jgi:quercetin dioxygenase-like cupin family protein